MVNILNGLQDLANQAGAAIGAAANGIAQGAQHAAAQAGAAVQDALNAAIGQQPLAQANPPPVNEQAIPADLDPDVADALPAAADALPELVSVSSQRKTVAECMEALRGKSIPACMALLNIQSAGICTNKTRLAEHEVKQVKSQIDTLNDLRGQLINAAAEDGSLDCTNNPELRRLLARARVIEPNIPRGMTFTRDRLDKLHRMIERKTQSLSTDLQVAQHKLTDAIRLRDTFMAEIKKCMDIIHNTIMMILRNMSSKTH